MRQRSYNHPRKVEVPVMVWTSAVGLLRLGNIFSKETLQPEETYLITGGIYLTLINPRKIILRPIDRTRYIVDDELQTRELVDEDCSVVAAYISVGRCGIVQVSVYVLERGGGCVCIRRGLKPINVLLAPRNHLGVEGGGPVAVVALPQYEDAGGYLGESAQVPVHA